MYIHIYISPLQLSRNDLVDADLSWSEFAEMVKSAQDGGLRSRLGMSLSFSGVSSPVCVYKYVYIYTRHAQVLVYICISTYVCKCTYVFIYIYIYMYIYMYKYIYIYIYVNIYMHVCMYIYTYIYTYIHVFIHIYVCVYVGGTSVD